MKLSFLLNSEDTIIQSYLIDKRQRIPKGQSTKYNPEKLATQGTQDKDKKKHKHNRICDKEDCADKIHMELFIQGYYVPWFK